MNIQRKQPLPPFLAPFFWSYDIASLDMEKDKKRIITNILNYGTKEATDWLFRNFERKDLEQAITTPLPGEWNKKSLNFWSLIFGVLAGNTARKVS